jgi:hypothetical protein
MAVAVRPAYLHATESLDPTFWLAFAFGLENTPPSADGALIREPMARSSFAPDPRSVRPALMPRCPFVRLALYRSSPEGAMWMVAHW